MKEDETTLSHKGKMDTHTKLCNEVIGGQLQESVGAERRTKLAHEDSQGKDKEKHSYTMLKKYDEELELLENLLRGPESEKHNTTREEKCSQMPYNEEVHTTSKKTTVNFKFQTDYEVAGIKSDDEHEVVIREI